MPDQNDDMVQALYNGLPPNPDINEALAPNDAIAKALMEYGQRQAQGVANLAMTPGKVAQGQQSVEEAGEWGPAMAMALMGRGMPTAEAGAAGIFGGRLAKTADMPALARAQVSQMKGATPTDIWHETGWFQGPDKQWRFEIPDAWAKAEGPKDLDPDWDYGDPNQSSMYPYTVGQAMPNHPELYWAYPDIKDMPIVWSQRSREGYHNPNLIPGGEHIALPPEDPSWALTPVALHELQHAIQWREGFPRGANFGQMSGYAQQAAKRMGVPLEESIVGEAGKQAYLRHAGETEARNVMRRYDAPGALSVPPWQTEDVPYAQQIVRPPFANSPYAGQPQPKTFIDLLNALKG